MQSPRILGHGERRMFAVHEMQQTSDCSAAVSTTHGHAMQAPEFHRDRLEQIDGESSTTDRD